MITYPLLSWWSAEKVSNFEVVDQVGGLRGSGTSNATSHQVDGLGDLDVSSHTLGDTTSGKLRGLGDGGDWGSIGSTSTLDGQEGEDECKDDGQDGNSKWEVIHETQDDADHDSGDDDHGTPHPGWNLVLSIKDVTSINFFLLFWVMTVAELLDTANNALVSSDETSRDNLVVEGKFCHGDDNHSENTWPQEPVSWGNVVKVGDVHAHVGDHSGNTLGLVSVGMSILDQEWSDDTPGEDSTEEEREGRVKTNKETGTNESWGEFNEPPPVDCQDSPVLDTEVKTPVVEPPEDVLNRLNKLAPFIFHCKLVNVRAVVLERFVAF